MGDPVTTSLGISAGGQLFGSLIRGKKKPPPRTPTRRVTLTLGGKPVTMYASGHPSQGDAGSYSGNEILGNAIAGLGDVGAEMYLNKTPDKVDFTGVNRDLAAAGLPTGTPRLKAGPEIGPSGFGSGGSGSFQNFWDAAGRTAPSLSEANANLEDKIYDPIGNFESGYYTPSVEDIAAFKRPWLNKQR